jgi:hypothetical protein
MKRLLVILTFISGLALGQINLVPNPSFETYTSCPTGQSQINRTGNWYMPGAGTSDYFNSCFTIITPSINMGVPANSLGTQIGFQNSLGYAGLYAWLDYFTPYREYIQTKLTATLTASQKYFVSMNVSLADSSMCATDDIGLYFSQSPITQSGYNVINVVPQISNPSGLFLTDNINWKKISGSFIAAGNEEYITIGNFKNDANTDTLFAGLPCASNASYYYIDNICVSTDSTLCNVFTGFREFSKKNYEIFYPNPTSGNIIINLTETSTIKLIDRFGQILMTIENFNENKLDLSGFSDGIYFIQIQSGNETSFSKIVIRR